MKDWMDEGEEEMLEEGLLRITLTSRITIDSPPTQENMYTCVQFHLLYKHWLRIFFILNTPFEKPEYYPWLQWDDSW